MSKLTEELEMGFISPTGEWIPASFCEHEEKAFEILEKLNYDACTDATDILIKKNVDIKELKFWNKIYLGRLNYRYYLDIASECGLGGLLTKEEFGLVKEEVLK